MKHIKVVFLILKILIVSTQGYAQSLKDDLRDCAERYRHHVNYFLSDDTKDNLELPLLFDKLFTAGAYISNPFPQQELTKLTTQQYGISLSQMTKKSSLKLLNLAFCCDMQKADIFYIYAEQYFEGGYIIDKYALPIPKQQVTFIVIKQHGNFLIKGIEKSKQNWTKIDMLDTDHDDIPAICDKCPCLAGGLEYQGGDPIEPCSNDKDSDGDGTFDSCDKCPFEFGEPEDGGCPYYTNDELRVIAKINEAERSGAIVLDLQYDKLTRLPTIIKKLTNLKKLLLNVEEYQFRKLNGQNSVKDISILKNLKQLTWLSAPGNQIKDITILKELKQLVYLDLEDNDISDINALSNLKNLTHLKLLGNLIWDLKPLKNIKQLIYLDIEKNLVSDITPLQEVSGLQYLKLSRNFLRDNSLKTLSKLIQLKGLDIGLNTFPFKDVSVLESLRNLEELDVSYNEINYFTFDLKDFPHLILLYLDGNPIKNIPKDVYKYNNWNEGNCVNQLREYQRKNNKWKKH